MTEVTNELIYEVLKTLQKDMGDMKLMRSETRDGFASIRQHLSAMQSDYQILERRVAGVEEDLERIKVRLEISDT